MPPKASEMMRFLLSLLLLALHQAASAQPKGPVPADKTEVVILGVDHSAQLINRRQQPGATRAFFDAIAPSAICIERSPERFARNDHYEFTYEIQDIVVPWARDKGLPLCPFDWLPNAEDSALAFGIPDLETPPVTRRDSGFQGFLTFPEPRSRTLGLFFADAPEERDRHRRFYAAYPESATGDFPRRMFLYRTFMQAKRIAAAARNYPGRRILVVVGVMHKNDIEAILSGYSYIRIVQPSTVAVEPDATTVSKFTQMRDLVAIASFNLLGVQWREPAVDRIWMAEIVGELQRRNPGGESDLLSARLAELQGADPRVMLRRYLQIAKNADGARFGWTGVKDNSRIDSFFDPFGNLTVSSRASLEAARIYTHLGRPAESAALRSRLRASLDSDFKRMQLTEYWDRYIDRR